MRRRLWVILGAVGAIALILLAAASAVPFDFTNDRVQQALVAGVVVAVGWLAGFALRETSAHLGRVERLQDVHRAIDVEIRHKLQALGTADDLRKFGREMMSRIEGPDEFVPFIPREANDTIFRSVVDDIHILPQATIDPIVRYYCQARALDTLIDDMRSDGFARMSARRRALMYADYINLKINLLEYGQNATEAIKAYNLGAETSWTASQ